MIVFKNLRVKNFRSYGNKFTEFNFESGFDLISANNGAGKSSLMQSLTWCLFGKIPKLKISELINNINNKDMEVQLDFQKGTDSYKIIRAEKPKKFEIYKNNELIDQQSTVMGYQEKLEKEILGINLNTFNMLVSLDTSLLNKSFITMSTSERRDFLEVVLDIKILYYINQIITVRLNLLKTQRTELEYKLKTRNEMLNSEKNKYNDIVRINKDITENGNHMVKEKESKVKDLEEKLLKYDVAFEKIQESQKLSTELESELKELNKKLEDYKKKYKKCEKDIIHIEAIKNAAVECVSCGHVNMTEDIDEIEYKSLYELKNTLKEDLIDFKNKKDQLEIEYNKQLKIVNEKKRLQINQKSTKDELEYSKKDLEKTKNFKLLDENKEDIDRIQGEISVFNTELININNEEDRLNNIKILVSDDGIKKKIFQKYIPIFNKNLNEILGNFHLGYNIIFNEKFEIKILDRGEERSFYSFSASEKMRINLAIMFSFLKLVESKNGFSINVLIIDELLDNALSSESRDLVLRFLNYKINNKNKIIISHNVDIDLTTFDRIFNIKKENGFSSLQRKE